MSSNADLNSVLDDIIARRIDPEMFYSVYGTAVNVDEANRTCDLEPSGDDATRFDIRLQAIAGLDTGMVVIPKEGSFIGVTFVNRSTGFVSVYSEVDKVLVDAESFEFNGGVNGGLINVSDLVERINIIESDINDLKTALASWVPVPSDGGAALKAALASYFGSPLIDTVESDIEDTKVKH